ncbi:RNA polymerase sigma factor [Idiomarina aquatica]|uniref:RNA polymerase subunit sigma-70 n=1 Tax=Idiomarina aquatica TaxID=1327752 RepID=A0AA94ECM8_9GAMM|nr:sigma-70 family RNA polymerase sigma factor [Idiomarina aquatica]RUO39715.1 RNA polymerase subunit sigma-70 [Idiomarina aquatica]
MSETTDIALAAKGDKAAFKRLYDRHIRNVYGQVLRLTADASLTDDLVQEIFVQVWRSLPKFDQRSKFSTWLYSLANNVAITELRKQTRWFKRNQRAAEQEDPHRCADLEDGIDLGALDQLVIKLPEQTRQVFVLHALNNYSHQQIADLLGIAEGTSKSQFHRARNLMQEWL